MTKDPRVYLAHILQAAERIERYISAGRDTFLAETMVQDAVIRNFEIIGEAAKRVPEDFRSHHAEVPWRLMAAFRDVLIHGYEGVDLKQLWKVASEDLSPVRNAIARILSPLHDLEKELGGEKDPKP